MKILLTGATGFIGKSILAELRNRGFNVIGIGGPEQSNVATGEELRTCDITDRDNVMDLTSIGSVDAVVHAAGLAHRFALSDDSDFAKVNVNGVKNIAELAVKLGAGHFLLLSSVLVYGGAAGGSGEPITEETTPDPADEYGDSKLHGENAAREVCEAHSLSLTILRLVPTIGEGSKGNFAKLVRAIERGQFVWVGKGENRKSMVYVGDVARAVSVLLKKKSQDVEIFNIAASPIAMNELVAVIARTLGRGVPSKHFPRAPVLAGLRLISKIPFANRIKGLTDTLPKWLSTEIYSTEKIQRTYGFNAKTSVALAAERDIRHHLKNVESNRKKYR